MIYMMLNGQIVVFIGWYDQKDVDCLFNYLLLFFELIGGMEVYKLQQVDLIEGGIGGIVIVKMCKLLDMGVNSGFVSVKYGKGLISDSNKDIFGFYSFKNEVRIFGVLIVVVCLDGIYICCGVEVDNCWFFDVEFIVFVQDCKCDVINVMLQVKFVQGMDLGLNVLYLKFVVNNFNSSDYIFQGLNCDKVNVVVVLDFNLVGMCIYSMIIVVNLLLIQFFQVWVCQVQMILDSVIFDGYFMIDLVKFDFVVGMIKVKGGIFLMVNFQIIIGDVGLNILQW